VRLAHERAGTIAAAPSARVVERAIIYDDGSLGPRADL
jgi:hypothetical protein